MQEKVLDGSALERIRSKKRRRRLRNAVILCLLLTVLLLWLTGLGSIYADRIGNVFETLKLRLYPGGGFPVAVEVDASAKIAALQEAVVLVDDREAVVYSATGQLLRNFQHSYANPCLAAGNNRFCLYNQGGKELRIEGRSRSYGSITTQSSIWFALMSQRDTVAVATQHESYQGAVTVYSDNMEKLFSWYCAVAYPVTAAFSPDGRQIAVCCVSASGGTCNNTLYIVNAKGEKAKAERSGGLVLQVAWLAGDRLLVVYEDELVLYNASTLEVSETFLMSQPLLCCDLNAKNGPILVNGNIGSDTDISLTVLNKQLSLQRQAQVDAEDLPRKGSKMRWQCLQYGDMVWLIGSRQVLGFAREGQNDVIWDVSHQPVGLAGGQTLFLLTAGELTEYSQSKGI